MYKYQIDNSISSYTCCFKQLFMTHLCEFFSLDYITES